MDTKALRQKILDLAIRGKLVPQDPNDEPASVLLEKIRAEKQQLVKEGKLKAKDIKNDTIIFKGEDNLHYEKFADGSVKCIEDEIPFDLPDGWEWCRLKHICMMAAGKAKPTEKIKSKPFEGCFPCYGGNGIRGYVDEYNQDGVFTIIGRQGALCGNINTASGKFYATEHAVVTSLFQGIDFNWSNYILEALRLNEYATGAAQPGLSVANVLNVYVPVPPLKEQKLIAQKISESSSFIKLIDKSQAEISSAISATKSKILDLAIRGQLVPQDPNDEPASVLLDRIRAEKEALIKAGKIKRDKKESVIFKGEDNSYYDNIPSGWEVSSLSQLTTPLQLNDGDWILSENMTKKSNIKLIQLGSVGNMEYINKGFKYITEETFNKLNCTEIFAGYLLINRILCGDAMNSCIIPEIDGRLITTVDTCWISPSDNYNLSYLMYAISSSAFQKSVNINAAGTTRKRISKSNLIRLDIPIPPLAEQNRIVKAIEKYFNIINSISETVK